MGLQYASDLQHLDRFAEQDELNWPLRAWSEVFTPASLPFAQRIYTTSQDSVHPKQIVGYAAPDHTGMSWERLMRDELKMADNLA